MRYRNIYSPLLIISVFVAACGGTKNTTHTTTSKAEGLVIEKYANVLGVSTNILQNKNLYLFIDQWYGAPYKYGGRTKTGIDCSGFASVLYNEVYSRKTGGPCAAIFEQCKSVSQSDLKEGDLVFFKIEKNTISHVGIYLQNNKFVHASVKKGVMINDLKEPYYKKYYFKGGILK